MTSRACSASPAPRCRRATSWPPARPACRSRRGGGSLVRRDRQLRLRFGRQPHRQRDPARARQPRLHLRRPARAHVLAPEPVRSRDRRSAAEPRRDHGRGRQRRRLRRRDDARPGRPPRRRPPGCRADRPRVRIEFLRGLRKVFDGTHVNLPHVEIVRAREVSISSPTPFMLYADGDPVAGASGTSALRPRRRPRDRAPPVKRTTGEMAMLNAKILVARAARSLVAPRRPRWRHEPSRPGARCRLSPTPSASWPPACPGLRAHLGNQRQDDDGRPDRLDPA